MIKKGHTNILSFVQRILFIILQLKVCYLGFDKAVMLHFAVSLKLLINIKDIFPNSPMQICGVSDTERRIPL